MMKLRWTSKARCAACAATMFALARVAAASETQLVTETTNGTANLGQAATAGSSISDDGRFIVFASDGNNLVAGMPINPQQHVYVRDLVNQTTTRIGPPIGAVGGASRHPVISDDGSTVVFESSVALAANDTNLGIDVYAYTIASGAIECLSVGLDGNAAGGRTYAEGQGANSGLVSSNGNYVAFQSDSALTANDANGTSDVFVRDRSIGYTRLESVTSTGDAGNGPSTAPALSADGTYLVFTTLATDVAGAASPGIYRKDRLTGAMLRCDIDANNQTFSTLVYNSYAFSGDGQSLALVAAGANPAFGDTTVYDDVFVNDLTTQTISRVSQSSTGGQTDGSSSEPEISFDGRYVTFIAQGHNLVTADTTTAGFGGADVILRDTLTSRNQLISVSDKLTQGVGNAGFALEVSMSSDARYFAMVTYARLEAVDVASTPDLYRRDRVGFAMMADGGKTGTAGIPALSGSGSVAPGGVGTVSLASARPNANGFLFLALDRGNATVTSGPLSNAILVTPSPFQIVPITTDAAGSLSLPYALPDLPFVPALFLQCFIADPVAFKGASASNGVEMAF